jgi:outer membrane protein OmpA-like peptidoglycan-associated protein
MAFLSVPKKSNKGEAEKPFWISFSDLLTALMVLFLVAMAVAILAVTKGVRDIKVAEERRANSVDACMAGLQDVSQGFQGVAVRDHSIDFGPKAEFQLAKSDLTPEQSAFLRKFVPQVVAITKRSECKAWLKRIVVDGFASQDWTYLRNLNLSIERSERVLCVLLDPRAPDAPSEDDRRLIQKLFFVGGSSSNSLKQAAAESRRIELKIEFYDLKEPKETYTPDIPLSTDTTCPIDQK